MQLSAHAIVLSVRPHGETGAVVRALTRVAGVQPGYVRGGHARRLRPVLQPGNIVAGLWRARTEDQLAALTVELIHSRAAQWSEPLAAGAIGWSCAAAAATLPDGLPLPHVHDALAGLLAAVEAAPAARGWAAGLVRYELLLLGALGFALDLERCVATGVADDLSHVSPRSGGAVSRAAARGYEAKLLPLPAFLVNGGSAEWPDILDGLRLTGHFLARDVLIGRAAEALAARERLLALVKRAVA